jgi:hypothetical protein
MLSGNINKTIQYWPFATTDISITTFLEKILSLMPAFPKKMNVNNFILTLVDTYVNDVFFISIFLYLYL